VIDVRIEARAWRAALPGAAALARAAAKATLAAEGRENTSLAILFTDDARQQALNARFRGKDSATNVLSFPAPAAPDGQLGDIALALGVCAREAAEQGKTLADHVRHLTIHGVLHLLSYDHETEAEALVMEAKERAILASLGVADPYASAHEDHG
jgi:probable rRNA maturation factor